MTMRIESPNVRHSLTKMRPMTLTDGTSVPTVIRIPESDATVRYALADILPGSGDPKQVIISERVQFDTLGGRYERVRKDIAIARRILRLRMAEANRAARAIYKLRRKKSRGPWKYDEFKRIATAEYQRIANRAGVVDKLNDLLKERAKLVTAIHARKYPERRMETFTTAMALKAQQLEGSCNNATPLSRVIPTRNDLYVRGVGIMMGPKDGLATMHLRHPVSAIGETRFDDGRFHLASAVASACSEAKRLGTSWGIQREDSSTLPGYNRFLMNADYSASTPQLVDPDTDQDDEVKRALTFSRLQSLHGEEDREFVLARSIGELKDLPETVKGSMEFLKFLGSLRNNPIKAVSRLKTLQDLAGFYLGYKFAIAPTVADVKTLLSNTREYLVETRRTCVQLAQQVEHPTTRVMRRYRASDYPKYDKELGTFESQLPVTTRYVTDTVRLEFPPALPISVVYIRTRPYSGEEPRFQTFALNRANAWLWPQYVYASEDVSTVGVHRLVAPSDTFAKLYMDWLNNLNRSAQCDFREWAGEIPPGTDRKLWDSIPAQRVNRLGISLSHTPPTSPFSENGDWSTTIGGARVVGGPRPSRFEAPIYVRNLVSGVMYADYATYALRDFLRNRGSPFTRFISGTDMLLTMWELAPLSFVLDWFTTSHDLWETLQNLHDSKEVPEPENGYWSTTRCELWAALCNLNQQSWACSTWIPGHDVLVQCAQSATDELVSALSEYYRIAGLYRAEASGVSRAWTYIQPRWLDIQTSLLLKGDRGIFYRTGLYKAKRGELLPDFDWLTSFLRVKLKLTASKFGTLGAMALSWAK